MKNDSDCKINKNTSCSKKKFVAGKNLPYARWNNNPSRKGPIPYQLFHRVKQQIDKFFLFKIFEERLPEIEGSALGSVSEQIIIIWVKRSCNCFNKAN